MQLRLKEWRKKRGMTMAELGERVYRERQTILYYEKGTIDVSVSMLAKLAGALDCSVHDLLCDTPEPVGASSAAD